MRHAEALAGELTLITKGDILDRRGSAIAKLTEEFKRQASLLTEDAVELYDVALRWLVADLQSDALAELSEQLADIPNAPQGTIRILAFHDDIAVAGPVLTRSTRLESGDLIAVIGAKGQEHILLVAKRSDLTETITDRLITVGSPPVLQTLAANETAPLTPKGSEALLTRANADSRLADALADRFRLPGALRQRLVEDAAAILRAHLSASAATASTAAIDGAVNASIAASAGRLRDAPPFEGQRQPDLSHERDFLDLMRRRELRAALKVIAERARLDYDFVLSVFAHDDFELMTTVLRAADLSWQAAEETLAARATGLDRPAMREMMRNRFHMMSQRDASRRIALVQTARSAREAS
ncbi:MAG: DUF2336 domain-containing protein [Rhizobiales bacterium]|nr:DUF2336 domain-containing protein [Hyphomicrobiales bacterium]